MAVRWRRLRHCPALVVEMVMAQRVCLPFLQMTERPQLQPVDAAAARRPDKADRGILARVARALVAVPLAVVEPALECQVRAQRDIPVQAVLAEEVAVPLAVVELALECRVRVPQGTRAEVVRAEVETASLEMVEVVQGWLDNLAPEVVPGWPTAAMLRLKTASNRRDVVESVSRQVPQRVEPRIRTAEAAVRGRALAACQTVPLPMEPKVAVVVKERRKKGLRRMVLAASVK